MNLSNSCQNILPLLEEHVSHLPVIDFDFYVNSANLKVIVFIPSISFANPYASMLLLAFRHYFMEGKSFITQKPAIDFIFIVNHESTTDAFNLKTIADFIEQKSCFVHYDKSQRYFERFGIPTSKKLDDSACVFLLNEENKILWKTDTYRANGEKIKPLDNAIKTYLQMPNIASISASENQPLKIGDKAPNFLLKGILSEANESYFLDEVADLKILSFYPAAFSGILNTPKKLSNNQSCLNPLHCRKQTSLLDSMKLTPKNKLAPIPIFKKYLITNATQDLLELWKEVSDTEDLIYLNDEDGSISKSYNALNPEGYNTRITYVIDSNGIIKAIADLKTDEDIQTLMNSLYELI